LVFLDTLLVVAVAVLQTTKLILGERAERVGAVTEVLMEILLIQMEVLVLLQQVLAAAVLA
jgi:hypothetical protein